MAAEPPTLVHFSAVAAGWPEPAHLLLALPLGTPLAFLLPVLLSPRRHAL